MMDTRRIRTGIFGGSFNPIHNGHTQLGAALCDSGLVDELWYLVSPQNPLKDNSTLLHDEARLQLARLAVQDTPRLHVCDVEMHLPRPSYMVHTLEVLRQEYPDREFVLVIGADNWVCFDQWRDHQVILAHHHIIIYPRPGYEIDTSTLPHNVVLTDTPLINLSSTDIRKAIAAGCYNGYGINPLVWQEIQRQGYYTLDF